MKGLEEEGQEGKEEGQGEGMDGECRVDRGKSGMHQPLNLIPLGEAGQEEGKQGVKRGETGAMPWQRIMNSHVGIVRVDGGRGGRARCSGDGR